ncbi:MAG: hypothetical protein U0132_04150 [Gemmatimonadaceae bacterium]
MPIPYEERPSDQDVDAAYSLDDAELQDLLAEEDEAPAEGASTYWDPPSSSADGGASTEDEQS